MPFEIAKWIFAITIIISYVFLVYRYIRTLRVMRTGSVTECYLEPMAVIWQSMRITSSGQGWRRFLVFAELTKSKKGVNYIALFVYFQFKSALLILVAQGPRIAINAMTLYAVMQAKIIPGGDHAAKDRSDIEQFFVNIKTMIDTGNRQETVVYFAMLFSLVIWVIAALSLIIAVILYIFFLWHYIPKADGSLTNYCRRKVETRLERIVGKKIKKAIEKQNHQLRKEEERAIKKGEFDASKSRPTLPKLRDDDDASSIFSLQRTDTMNTNTTLPPYAPSPLSHSTTVNSNTGRSLMMKPSLPTLNERPGMPMRSETQFSAFSNTSYGPDVPMLSQAGNMGMSSPVPPMPLDRNGSGYYGEKANMPYAPDRSFTPMSQGRASPLPHRGPMPRVDTNFNNHVPYGSQSHVVSPLSNDGRGTPQGYPNRPYQEFSPYNSRGPAMGQEYELSPVDVNTTDFSSHYQVAPKNVNDYQPPQVPDILRVGSPAPSQSVGQPRAGTAPPRAGVPTSLQSPMQRRDMSQPLPNRDMNGSVPPQRSATAPIQQPGWARGPPSRSYTPSGPGPQRSNTPGQRDYDNGYNP